MCVVTLSYCELPSDLYPYNLSPETRVLQHKMCVLEVKEVANQCYCGLFSPVISISLAVPVVGRVVCHVSSTNLIFSIFFFTIQPMLHMLLINLYFIEGIHYMKSENCILSQ